MNRQGTVQSWFPAGHPETRRGMTYPMPDFLIYYYQYRSKRRSQCSQRILVLVPFLRPGLIVQLSTPWEGPHWRPQQARRKLLCPETSTSLSSRSSSASVREKRRLIHMASPSLANSTTAAKGTFSSSRAVAQPPLLIHVVTLQQAAYSDSMFGVKKLTLTKELKDTVPAAMRQHYLGLFKEECLKFTSSYPEAMKKAQSEEKMVYDKCPSKNRYLNDALHTLKKLRGLVPSAVPAFSQATLYKRLQSYLLTEEERKENGFPFAHPEKPGSAMLFTEDGLSNPTHRTCCRCYVEYPVSSSGGCLSSDPCVFHSGRIHSIRVLGGWEMQYSCCNALIGSKGCVVAKQHVQDGRKNNLRGFAKTFPKKDWEAHPGIYALDCEMCYTTHGLELTRISVVDTYLRVIYDTFVKPDNDIVDYMTKFSGVTEADLANTNVRLRDVQAVLLSLFSTETILIGHSLESDLLALKFIHNTVVDTSVLFPHHRGYPFKRSLRSLVAQYLNRNIQNHSSGHNSIEDAIACMQLVTWKVQEDAKICTPQQQVSCPKCRLQQLKVFMSRSTQTPTILAEELHPENEAQTHFYTPQPET
ncbi:RNA exonuclease 1-like protein [Microtus ochrogaster]|uniref:RNA exonuclease 1-like protein n=2 Tax=Microtus ochrogaster TaxID=79684 RepID=A0A8J6G5L5_MICOH|nr:RNA exonuclease 1-like protein [Microtus ochrogaster]